MQIKIKIMTTILFHYFAERFSLNPNEFQSNGEWFLFLTGKSHHRNSRKMSFLCNTLSSSGEAEKKLIEMGPLRSNALHFQERDILLQLHRMFVSRTVKFHLVHIEYCISQCKSTPA